MAVLSNELVDQAQQIAAYAREESLDFFETVFEMVDFEQMNQIAAYGGFPQRYPHWRFGMEYERLRKQHAYGLGKIYERKDTCIVFLYKPPQVLPDRTVRVSDVYVTAPNPFAFSILTQLKERSGLGIVDKDDIRSLKCVMQALGILGIGFFIDL